MDTPIRIALAGAGVFARDAHLPALTALADRFTIAAVYSRTQASAERLAAQLADPVTIYTDFAALLAHDNLDAVDILLPIEQLPAAVEAALAAGKHVVSEKPIAPDLASGRRLLEIATRHPDQVWMVAENWRYETAFLRAAEIIRSGTLGNLAACHWAVYIPLTPDNKYYQTPWRRTGTFPGGFILDGGVHQIAALRLVLGEITAVSAQTQLMRPDLPPADTLAAVLEFERGIIGSLTMTFAAGAPWAAPLHIVGLNGAFQVDRGELMLTTPDGTQHETLPDSRSVDAELRDFADAITRGQPHRNTPAAALQDVAVIEALLQSAATGQRVTVERIASQ
ncbi:MAG: Gfo/Idh/MocA family oxidoreductase [Chloroflexi bacterium]|nr:Gfo/Idh/MocA family oxidoreductase [Chloroflexota bacterium]